MIDVKGKYIFLSGPMSDDPETYHAHDFIDAHIRLKAAGAKKVYDPAIGWLTYAGDDEGHEYWMHKCINELISLRHDYLLGATNNRLKYDLLVSLPGWKFSEGAKLERTVATACGITSVDWSELEV